VSERVLVLKDFRFCSVFRYQFQKNLRRLVSQLYVRDNCHPFKASLLVWVQLPLWVSLSLALRNLSSDQSGRNLVFGSVWKLTLGWF